MGGHPARRLPLVLRDHGVGRLRPPALDEDPRRDRPPARLVRAPPGSRGDRPRPGRRPCRSPRPRRDGPVLARGNADPLRGAVPAAVGGHRAAQPLRRRRRGGQLLPATRDRAAGLAPAPLRDVPLVRRRDRPRNPVGKRQRDGMGVVELRRRDRPGRLPDRLPDRHRDRRSASARIAVGPSSRARRRARIAAIPGGSRAPRPGSRAARPAGARAPSPSAAVRPPEA